MTPAVERPHEAAALRAGGLWVIVALGLALTWWGARPPSPLPLDAPSSSFSAARALRDVRVIGAVAHPSGSEAVEGVRREVAARLTAVGVPASLGMALGVGSPPRAPQFLAAANVQNVLGVLPGRDPRQPGVLVMAHYDSVESSPGAADDGAGVATLIEIARSLAADAHAHGPAARDVIFLATDAEEAGLLGARAFFASDPTASRVGVVVNLEARGDAGCAAMFQTGPRDGAFIRLYAKVVRRPCANSLAGFVAGVLPNDTDFSVARAQGLGGFNFAMIDDELAYHTPLATPAHLDPRSLQSLGGQALPLVRALSQAPAPPAPAPDRAYADLFGRWTVDYPATAGGWAALIVTALLAIFAGLRARRLRLLDGADVVRGAGLVALAILAAALALRLVGRVLEGDEARLYTLLGRYDLLFAGCAILVLGVVLTAFAAAARGRFRRVAVAIALACGVAASLTSGLDLPSLALGGAVALLAFVTLERPVSPWGAWFGAVAVGFGLAAVVQALAPPASFVLVWPLLCGCLGAAAAFGLGARAPRVGLGLAGLSAILALGLVGGWSAAVFAALGPGAPEALAFIATPALFALTPFVRLWSGERAAPGVALTLGALGVAIIAVVGLGGGTRARPAPTRAYYLSEPASGHAWRVAPDARLDPWTRAVLRLGGAPPARVTLDRAPLPADRVWATAAAVAPIAPPELIASYDAGRVILTLRAGPQTRALEVGLRSAGALADPRLDARPVVWPSGPPGVLAGLRVLRFTAPSSEGVTLSFAAPAHGAAQIVAIATSDGWPAGLPSPPPKPDTLMGSRGSDTTRVMTRTRFAW